MITSNSDFRNKRRAARDPLEWMFNDPAGDPNAPRLGGWLPDDESFGDKGRLYITMDGRPASWCTCIVPCKNDNSKYLAGFYEIWNGGHPSDYQNISGIVRLDSNGVIDKSFGTRGDGIIEVRFKAGQYSSPKAIHELSDGRILISGDHTIVLTEPVLRSYPNAMLCMLNANGTVDTTFGNQGIFDIGALKDDFFYLLNTLPLADGKIILTGSFIRPESPAYSYLIRLTVDGKLDESFQNNGMLAIERVEGLYTHVDGMLWSERTDTILVYGYYNKGYVQYNFLAHFNSDGELNTGFGTGGFFDMLKESNNPMRLRNVSSSSDGRNLYFSGSEFSADGVDRCRLEVRLSNGTPDTTFNNGNPVLLGARGYNFWFSSLIQPASGGKIIALGHSSDYYSALLARYLPSGELDTSFSDEGFGSPAFSNLYSGTWGQGAVVEAGRILCVGYTSNGGAIMASKI